MCHPVWASLHSTPLRPFSRTSAGLSVHISPAVRWLTVQSLPAGILVYNIKHCDL